MNSNFRYSVLIPVWGKAVPLAISTVLNSIRSDRNIKYLRNQAYCEIIIYTNKTSISKFEMFKDQLQKLDIFVRFKVIDKYMPSAPVSMILTYCVIDFLRSCYKNNSYGIILNSDFILADGSLEEIHELNKEGIDNIYTGNYQCTPEALDYLNLISNEDILSFSRNELIEYTTSYMGHTTLNQIVNFTDKEYEFRQKFQNRLFWRTKYGLIGSFFLIHPFCIRPSKEIMSIFVDASFDYIIYPPYTVGKSKILSNAEKHFIIEIQDESHELENKVRRGKDKNYIKNLQNELGFWVTSQHIKNSKTLINLSSNNEQQRFEGFENIVSNIRDGLIPNGLPHKYWQSLIFDQLSNQTRLFNLIGRKAYLNLRNEMLLPEPKPYMADDLSYLASGNKNYSYIFEFYFRACCLLMDASLWLCGVDRLIYVDSTFLLAFCKYSKYLTNIQCDNIYDTSLDFFFMSPVEPIDRKIFFLNVRDPKVKSIIGSQDLKIKLLPVDLRLWTINKRDLFLLCLRMTRSLFFAFLYKMHVGWIIPTKYYTTAMEI